MLVCALTNASQKTTEDYVYKTFEWDFTFTLRRHPCMGSENVECEIGVKELEDQTLEITIRDLEGDLRG